MFNCTLWIILSHYYHLFLILVSSHDLPMQLPLLNYFRHDIASICMLKIQRNPFPSINPLWSLQLSSLSVPGYTDVENDPLCCLVPLNHFFAAKKSDILRMSIIINLCSCSCVMSLQLFVFSDNCLENDVQFLGWAAKLWNILLLRQ